MWRQKGYTSINIFGLAVGLAIFMLVALYIQNELSYDRFHENFGNLYRVQHYVENANGTRENIETPYPLADFLAETYPEVDGTTLLDRTGSRRLSTSEDGSFLEADGYYAESSFFDLFSFEQVEGELAGVLDSPDQIVLTNSLSQTLFPGQNPLGKTLTVGDRVVTVAAVIEDVPTSSNLRFDYLLSFGSAVPVNDWADASYYTYVLLDDSNDVESMNGKIVDLLDDRMADNSRKLYLKPLEEIHLKATIHSEATAQLYYYGLIALSVLVLSCVNFINSTTARSGVREREIGIRKLLGAKRGSLVWQHLSESLVVAFLALCVSFLIAELLLPLFNEFTGRALEIAHTGNWEFVVGISIIFLLTGLLAGIYPGFYLSSVKPLVLFQKQGGVSKGGRHLFRRGLLGFQFVVSISLILCTLLVRHHIDFMKTKDLGFEAGGLFRTSVNSTDSSKTTDLLTAGLLNSPYIEGAAVSKTIPMFYNASREINREDAPTDETIYTSFNEVSHDFIDTYGMELILGRNFSRELITDRQSVIINRTMMEALGWADPIGKRIDDNQYTIIGVVEDFHALSTQDRIRPYAMILHPGTVFGSNFYTVRISGQNYEAGLAHVQSVFNDQLPGQPVEVSRYRDNMDSDALRVWEGVEKSFSFFSIAAVVLAIIGLLGQVSFVVLRRTREIGIRKILGASVPGIFAMITKEFVVLQCLALLIAVPLSYYVYDLAPGGYKYSVQVADIALPVIVILAFTLVMVLYQCLNAAWANPVESLRSE